MSTGQEKPCDSIPRRHYSLKPPTEPTHFKPQRSACQAAFGLARTSTRTKGEQRPDWQLALASGRLIGQLLGLSASVHGQKTASGEGTIPMVSELA